MIMREIKFRTYDIEFKEYNDYHFNRTSLRDFVKWNDRFVLEQYTGLIDGNGNEIYEGDFIKFRPNYTNKPVGESIGLVVFNDNQWMLKANEHFYSISEETDEFYCYSSIVGNVHENPELLCTSQST